MNKYSNHCSLCGKESYKIIYYGIPAHFCKDEECNCMYGFWSFIFNHLPFTGWMYVYNDSYLKALYCWVFNKE